jgi:hypothetical protein
MSSISGPFFVIMRMMTPSSVSMLQCLGFCYVFLSYFLSCHSRINFQWCREARLQVTCIQGETWCVLKALLFIRAVCSKVSHKVLPFFKKSLILCYCSSQLPMQDCVFYSPFMYLPHLSGGLGSTPSQQLHTNGIFFVVRCLLLMVTLQIPVAQNVKSRSIKRPSVRGVQTLGAFLCFGSLCPRTTAPFCHNSAPELIKCSTLYPGIKGIEDSFCCKGVPRSMA